jgi:hypothetical protein
MDWTVDLVGDAFDIEALKLVAGACDAVIAPGPEGRHCLGGPKFREAASVGEMLVEAAKVLTYLNGLVRIDHADHRTVRLGSSVILRDGDGKSHHHLVLEGVEMRMRAGSIAFLFEPPGASAQGEKHANPRITDMRRLVEEPDLAAIIEWLGADSTWARLRGALEKILHAMGKKPKAFNVLVNEKYATQEEIDAFRANALDPRVSGRDAVHGVPDGPVKGAKWTERQGLEFVSRILKEHLSRTRPGT